MTLPSTDTLPIQRAAAASSSTDQALPDPAAVAARQEQRRSERQRWLRRVTGALLLASTIPLLLGLYWGREPAPFDIQENLQQRAPEVTEPERRPGLVLTATLIGIAHTLLDKSGGYISNDVVPPGIWMDNMQSWEFGVLTALRDTVRALRDDFARSQSQSAENRELQRADAQFHFDHRHWMLPSSEEEYHQGVAALERYLQELGSATAERSPSFFVRADNLIAYLEVVEKRLGNLTQRLSANVDQVHFSADPLMQEDIDGGLVTPTQETPQDIPQRTNWWDVDRVFYESRGYVWALSHLLRAIELDFHRVLASKNAQIPLRRIVAKLESTQRPVWSPTIFNHSGFGILTNHSLVMASYISRANAALIDLRLLLTQG